MRRPLAAAAALAALAALALLPTAAAKGIVEDAATYPPGVTAVTRTAVQAGEEFSVVVSTDQPFEQAAMVICRFRAPTDADPIVCWSQIPASPLGEGASGFTANSAGGAHPAWEDGWTIGYKFTLTGPGREAHVPATGGEYYKVLVGEAADTDPGPGQYTSRAAPFCALCVGAIAIALAVRRRMDA